MQSLQGVAHPEFDSLQQGRPSTGAAWLGWAFGVAAIGLVFATLALGLVRRRSLRGVGWPLLAVLIATIAAWTGVIVSYVGYVTDPQQPLLFGWPMPTALMLFVLLPLMCLVNVVFVVWFPKSILTEEDLNRFDEIMKQQEEREYD